MSVVAVVGLQWGDEGKGKIVDLLSKKFDIVARYNGGANAGHTVVYGEKTLKLHLIPSGVLWNKELVLGSGMVLDIEELVNEIKELKKLRIKPNLKISLKAHIVMPYHKQLEVSSEKQEIIGTTGRGIGPCYSDKARRISAIRVSDLFSKNFEEKLDFVLKNKLFELKMARIIKNEEELENYKKVLLFKYKKLAKYIKKYVTDVEYFLNGSINKKKKILLEGAQGTMLDIDHGTFPYVTSSNPTIGGACIGLGIAAKHIKKVIGVAKAYTTRVGKGPLPTEIKGKLAEKIREKGNEYGTTTGRPRRCGWLDLVQLKYACIINGVDEIALTKLDVLSGIGKLKIAVAYKAGRKIIRNFLPVKLENVKPIYEEIRGWEEKEIMDWKEIMKAGYDALPKEAKSYINFIEKRLKVPIKLISVGAERDMVIWKEN